MSIKRCKYCCKELVVPCECASDANRCENSHPDVKYSDKTGYDKSFTEFGKRMEQKAFEIFNEQFEGKK